MFQLAAPAVLDGVELRLELRHSGELNVLLLANFREGAAVFFQKLTQVIKISGMRIVRMLPAIRR